MNIRGKFPFFDVLESMKGCYRANRKKDQNELKKVKLTSRLWRTE